MTRKLAIQTAMEESKNGYIQHANVTHTGEAYVSDWYDSDSTVASFMNGEYI